MIIVIAHAAMKSLKFKQCIGVEWLNTENAEYENAERSRDEAASAQPAQAFRGMLRFWNIGELTSSFEKRRWKQRMSSYKRKLPGKLEKSH